MAASLMVILFAGSGIWIVAVAAEAGPGIFLHYPPAPVIMMRTIGLVLCAMALAGLAGLWPAWRSSGWGILRKAHYTAFALALVFFAVMLAVWNVVFAPTA